jgi:AcrR family transcriptional regulator
MWQAHNVGRPAQIDRAAVIGATLAIADKRGLDAVTMKAVADRLGVTPMALYRHVTNKADLLDGVVESLITEIEIAPPELPWRDRLSTTVRSVRRVAKRHPDVFALLLQLPANTSVARGMRDEVHVWLRDVGIAEESVASAERLLTTLIFGYALSEATGRFRGHTKAEIDRDYAVVEAVVEQTLQMLRHTHYLPTQNSSRRTAGPERHVG